MMMVSMPPPPRQGRKSRHRPLLHWHLRVPLLLVASGLIGTLSTCLAATAATSFLPSNHTSNHAVIVSSSKYWFNYRHVSNALLMYQLLRRDGNIPDENIVLMLADDIPGNPRNPVKNGIYVKGVEQQENNLLDNAVQVDYRGDDVTVENFLKVLLSSSNNNNMPVLHTNAESHILVYLTGHGGNQFFKFQDAQEVTSQDLGLAFDQMHERGLYKEILFIADTCQAFSLADHIIKAPNVYAIGSSLVNENSYAHHADRILGQSVVDRYTYLVSEYIQRRQHKNNNNLGLKEALVDSVSYAELRAHVGFRDDHCERPMDQVALSDFFANVMPGGNNQQQRRPVMLVRERWNASLMPLLRQSSSSSGSRPQEECRDDDEIRRKLLGDQKYCSTETTTTTATKSPPFVVEDAATTTGMHPTDPRFLASVALLIVGVLLSSRIV